MDRVIFS